VATSIRLTDVSVRPCSLSGRPTFVTGIAPDGVARPLQVQHDTMFNQQAAWPANLHRRDHAQIVIATGDNCNALARRQPRRQPYVGVILGLPGGGSIRSAASFDAACGVGTTHFGTPRRGARDRHAYRGLRLHVDAPATATEGSLLRFRVTLVNTSRRLVRLKPCPTYQEYVNIRHLYAKTFTLNCATVTSIQPGRSITYAMQIPIPDQTGSAKLGWDIPKASLYFASTLMIGREIG
jgi:hypothetical protein